MFVRKKKPSPEEKLLKLIEQPHSSPSAAAARRIPFLIQGFRFKMNTVNILGLSNNILLFIALAFTGIFIFILAKPAREISAGKRISLNLSEEKDEALKEYTALLKNRNPFKADFRKIGVEEAAEEKKVDLKLVGILDLLGEQQALIEVEGNTYTCSVGDAVVENIKVKEIGRNSVTLEKNGKTFSIK